MESRIGRISESTQKVSQAGNPRVTIKIITDEATGRGITLNAQDEPIKSQVSALQIGATHTFFFETRPFVGSDGKNYPMKWIHSVDVEPTAQPTVQQSPPPSVQQVVTSQTATPPPPAQTPPVQQSPLNRQVLIECAAIKVLCADILKYVKPVPSTPSDPLPPVTDDSFEGDVPMEELRQNG